MGDVLLASGFISYAGPFSKNFRVNLIDNEFIPFIKKRKIPKSLDLGPV